MAHHNQGSEGACVGFGIAHELRARPSEVEGVTSFMARDIYLEAQKIDPWPGGSYPGAGPQYEGTSVLAGIKVAQKMGYFDSYRWAFGLHDLMLGVGYNGPAVLGVPWYEGMFDIDNKGFIHATGRIMGGHCILCKSVNIKKNYFILHNSWGLGWGNGGDCYISFQDMSTILANDGEAAFMLHRHKVAQPLP